MFIWQFGYSISGAKTVCTINWFPELLGRTDNGDWEVHVMHRSSVGWLGTTLKCASTKPSNKHISLSAIGRAGRYILIQDNTPRARAGREEFGVYRQGWVASVDPDRDPEGVWAAPWPV